MKEHQKLLINQFNGGVTESADLSEGQFTDSLNLVPDRNRSRLVLRAGIDSIYSNCAVETPVQILGVRDASCACTEDEIIMASCLFLTHIRVPLDVSCLRSHVPCSFVQCVKGLLYMGGAEICHFRDCHKDRHNPDGLYTCFKCTIQRCWNIGRPPYAFTQSSEHLFFNGQGCNAYLAYADYLKTDLDVHAAIDRSLSSSTAYSMVAYCFRCAHCWMNSCWWLNAPTLRKNICCKVGSTFYKCLTCNGIDAYQPEMSCWDCVSCWFTWWYSRSGKDTQGNAYRAHCWNFAKGCYPKPCWASNSTPVFIPCYQRCCALFPYANVLAYHKGRVFFGVYRKKNATFTEVYYHSTDDGKADICGVARPRYDYWRPWDETAVTPVDGNVLTVPTSPNSYITGMVGVENGLLIFFTDRIMLWQWPDSSAPHDSEGGARIETIYTGVGAIHQRAIQTYLNSIYFIGRAPDGYTRLMKLDESLALSQESKAIDNRINCFDFRPTSTCIDTAMYRDSFFMRLGKRVYLYDLVRKAWYPLQFNWLCHSNPIVSMAASRVTDRLYISVFDCFSPTEKHTDIYVFPQGLSDYPLISQAICWKLEFDNLDFGDGGVEKYVRDVVVEFDNCYNEHPITAKVYDATTCLLCATVAKYPTNKRRDVQKFEIGKRLKNISLILSGTFDAGAFAATHRDEHDGRLGIDSINIRYLPRSSVED